MPPALTAPQTSSLLGANRIFVGDQEILAGLGPQGILVRCDNDFDIYGVSLSVRFDPAALQVRTVETVGVASDAEWVPGAGTGTGTGSGLLHSRVLGLNRPVSRSTLWGAPSTSHT